jgi:hypothetical protein
VYSAVGQNYWGQFPILDSNQRAMDSSRVLVTCMCPTGSLSKVYERTACSPHVTLLLLLQRTGVALGGGGPLLLATRHTMLVHVAQASLSSPSSSPQQKHQLQSQLQYAARKAVVAAREPQAHGEPITQVSSPLRHLPPSALQQRLLQRAAGVVWC